MGQPGIGHHHRDKPTRAELRHTARIAYAGAMYATSYVRSACSTQYIYLFSAPMDSSIVSTWRPTGSLGQKAGGVFVVYGLVYTTRVSTWLHLAILPGPGVGGLPAVDDAATHPCLDGGHSEVTRQLLSFGRLTRAVRPWRPSMISFFYFS
ncbi:hypothetical protein VTG60DRAFT_3901 [Thermothelomyces hinnuleus]